LAWVRPDSVKVQGSAVGFASPFVRYTRVPSGWTAIEAMRWVTTPAAPCGGSYVMTSPTSSELVGTTSS
jgi:hypothetical protein